MTSSKVEEARSELPVRGSTLLRPLENGMRRFDHFVESLIPTQYNPFAQTGAIATAAFIVASVTGIALLIWYRPSVHLAHETVLTMEASWSGSFLRSLHRYSSDLCIFFALIHALRLFFSGRLTGARWLAWVTGILLVGLLWFIGWTGYLLVWDQQAQLAMEGSTRFLDLIPIFSEPVSRSFLANDLVPSLVFFVIFFTHMLLPLVMGVGIWLHVARVQRPRVLTSRWMGIWTVAALVLLSLIVPAVAGPAADLSVRPENLTIDAWYLAPLWLTDYLAAGLVWAVLAIGTGLLVSMPWWMKRGTTKVAEVNTRRCNGCTLCARDCPYDAIVMVPRTDDSRYEMQARIDPMKCVGCGICAGACDGGAIGLDWLPVQATRKKVDHWIDEFIEDSAANDDGQPGEDEQQGKNGPVIAFLCSNSAAADFVVDAETGSCTSLPGYRVVAVPCAGWVQPISLERALRRGAAGVLIVGCSEEDPEFREGNRWLGLRLAGSRKPHFRREKVSANRVRHWTYDRTRPLELIDEAAAFRKLVTSGQEVPNALQPSTEDSSRTGRHIAGGLLVAVLTMAIVALGSHIPYPGPPEEDPTLVLSVKHHGTQSDSCRPLTEEEISSRPKHMQQSEICDRRRADVVIEVEVDDEVLYSQAHAPGGLSGDGPAVTLDALDLPPGDRNVVVRIADTHDGEWRFEESWHLPFGAGERQVILFDTGEGFRHFGADR